MSRFIESQDRSQVTLLPECLDDYIAEDNTVRVVDAFIGELDMLALGFEGATPAATGRPSYHPAIMLKIYLYGYLNRIQSSRRLERECQRNVELMWLTGRLTPDFKTVADFRRDNSAGIRNVCRRFVVLCRDLKLFSQALVAIDGSKFKAVNSRDCNFTNGKIDKRQQQIEESIQRYLSALDTADRTQPVELKAKTVRLQDKIARLRQQMRELDASHASHYSGSSGSTTTRVSPPPQVNNLSSDDTAAPHVKAPPAAPVAPARPVLSTQEKLKLQIMRVQISLTSLGLYRGPANGVMTAETQTAIRNFQTVKGIPENGMMTTPTLNALGVPAVN